MRPVLTIVSLFFSIFLGFILYPIPYAFTWGMLKQYNPNLVAVLSCSIIALLWFRHFINDMNKHYRKWYGRKQWKKQFILFTILVSIKPK